MNSIDKVKAVKALQYPKPVPEGPYGQNSNNQITFYNYGIIRVEVLADMLNRAYSIGRWQGQMDEQPPPAKDSDYKPVCKFCGEMVDNLIIVHLQEGTRTMCQTCFELFGANKFKALTDKTKPHKYVPTGFGNLVCRVCLDREDNNIHHGFSEPK